MILKYSFAKVTYQSDMKLDPKHLAILHTIRERGGLTAAAERMGTSQPALSRVVGNMETRLGTQIFDRNSRPWRLTEIGESLARQGGAIEAALLRANQAVEQFRFGDEGLIRLGGTPYLCESVLPSIVADFQKCMPGACIEQSYAYTGQLLRQLQRRDIDLVIAPVDSSEIGSGLIARKLLKARNIIVCRNNHELTKVRKPALKSLLDYRWIAPHQDSPLAADLRDILNEANAREFNTAFSGGALATVAQLLEETDCLTMLPTYVFKKLQLRYELATVNIDLSTPTRSIDLISNADEVRSFMQQRFSDHVEQSFKQL